ncbi:hypothetical protein Syun_004721 [Stephania yunnanensis]|uniref:Uncharacterized protein n=1 Tax=Stephania yunnanensis TaxID=152371 RepID=A0AAP0L6W7_9MAGN
MVLVYSESKATSMADDEWGEVDEGRGLGASENWVGVFAICEPSDVVGSSDDMGYQRLWLIQGSWKRNFGLLMGFRVFVRDVK